MPLTAEPEPSFSFARRVLVGTLVVVAVLSLLALVWRVLDVLVLFFAATLVAILLSAAVELVQRVTRLPRAPSLFLVLAIATATLWAFARGLAPHVVAQLRELAATIPQALQAAYAHVASTSVGRVILDGAGAGDAMGLNAADLLGRLRGAFSITLGLIGSALLVVLAGIYLAWDPGRYAGGAMHLLPKSVRARAGEVLHEVKYTLRNWLLARAVAMVVVGMMTAIGLSILAVPLALALGFIAGASSFVPIVGFLFAGLLIVLFSLTQGTTTVLWVVALYLAVQWIEGNLISPIVEYRAVRVPPALSLLAQLVMAIVLGVVGVLFASPLVAALFVVVRMLYVEDILGDTQPGESEQRRRARSSGLGTALKRALGRLRRRRHESP